LSSAENVRKLFADKATPELIERISHEKETIYRDQISHGKPDPEMFLTTAERLGLDAKRCIVVEDSLSGFRAAERAGMKYIVITTGADAEELKHAGNACAMYEDFTTITVRSLMGFL